MLYLFRKNPALACTICLAVSGLVFLRNPNFALSFAPWYAWIVFVVSTLFFISKYFGSCGVENGLLRFNVWNPRALWAKVLLYALVGGWLWNLIHFWDLHPLKTISKENTIILAVGVMLGITAIGGLFKLIAIFEEQRRTIK